ncbi:MAG TPA: hypothetical protein VMT58_01645 [Candidatus Binataceae bacterium]|nr:hypothetical protein [Candidatus Binataceae bacterium]
MMRETTMAGLVTSEERRHEIRKTLWVLIGVMITLVAIALVTIIAKH